MLSLLSPALLGLSLLAAPVETPERPPLPTCETGTRSIELTADAPNPPTEVCIRPELALNLLFDAKLSRVDVEGRERFRRVNMGDDWVMLVPSDALHDGERVPVTVSFLDGVAPVNATITLVVHPSQAERQVEVSRRARTRASLRLGEQWARADTQQHREDEARLQAECSAQGGLTGLILGEWLREKGVVARVLKVDTTFRAAMPLEVHRVISYWSVGLKGRARVAVEVELWNGGAQAWTPSGAVLVGAKGEALTGLTVAPLKPIPPGWPGRIVVELESAENVVRGPFTLKLWAEEAEAGSVSIDGVTFP